LPMPVRDVHLTGIVQVGVSGNGAHGAAKDALWDSYHRALAGYWPAPDGFLHGCLVALPTLHPLYPDHYSRVLLQANLTAVG
jgi:hypothetical protein